MVLLRFESFWHSRRKLLVLGLFAFTIVLLFLTYQRLGLPSVRLLGAHPPQCDHDPPANWDKLYKWEDDLPQHDVHLPFPEGETGRYVYFRNQIRYLGWNNQLNEVYVIFSLCR
jgi:hypothetical protein